MLVHVGRQARRNGHVAALAHQIRCFVISEARGNVIVWLVVSHHLSPFQEHLIRVATHVRMRVTTPTAAQDALTEIASTAEASAVRRGDTPLLLLLLLMISGLMFVAMLMVPMTVGVTAAAVALLMLVVSVVRVQIGTTRMQSGPCLTCSLRSERTTSHLDGPRIAARCSQAMVQRVNTSPFL